MGKLVRKEALGSVNDLFPLASLSRRVGSTAVLPRARQAGTLASLQAAHRVPHTQNEPDYPLDSPQQRTPITIDSLVPRNIAASPRFELQSHDNQLRGSIATQNDRLHNDLRNLIKQKLIGMSEPASSGQIGNKEEVFNGADCEQRAPRSPVDLRQLKGVYSKNYEHIHGNVMISAGEKRYKVVGYSQK